MKSISELSAKQIAEWEEYLADLDAEYSKNRADVTKRIRTLKNGNSTDSEPPTSGGPQNLYKPEGGCPDIAPMDAIKRMAPAMDYSFSFPELLEAIRTRYPEANLEKEAVRGAFRVYVKRADCPIIKVEKSDPREINRYKKRSENGVFPEILDKTILPVGSNRFAETKGSLERSATASGERRTESRRVGVK